MERCRLDHRFTLACVAALALGAPRAASAEALTYEGATTIGTRIVKDAAPLFEKKTGHRFRAIQTAGSGAGFKAAMSGEASVGGVARALTDKELAAKPGAVVIGYDAIGVFVNDANPVKVLTKAQLRGIFTGSITNWKEVGGKDLAIVACSEPPASGRATVETFKAMILETAAYGPLTERPDASDCVKLASKEPAAIGAASMAYYLFGARALPVDGVKPIPSDIRSGAYLLARPLTLVSKGPPTGATKQFFDFMVSPEGQKVVSRNFTPLH